MFTGFPRVPRKKERKRLEVPAMWDLADTGPEHPFIDQYLRYRNLKKLSMRSA